MCEELGEVLASKDIVVHDDSLYHAGRDWYYDGWSHGDESAHAHAGTIEMLEADSSLVGFGPILVHEAAHYMANDSDHGQYWNEIMSTCGSIAESKTRKKERKTP
jgi:hypothetical protein